MAANSVTYFDLSFSHILSEFLQFFKIKMCSGSFGSFKSLVRLREQIFISVPGGGMGSWFSWSTAGVARHNWETGVFASRLVQF